MLGEPWLELLADCFLRCCCSATTDDQTFRPQDFSGARLFSFLNKGLFSTLSPQSAGVFLKMGYESGKFRAKGVKDVRYF